MRLLFTRLHRWFGLATAAFLFVAGSTGAIIAWDHELDGWLNPEFYDAASGLPAEVPALALADRLEASDPRIQVMYLELSAEPGHTLTAFGGPRVDPATGALYDVDYNQVAWDPATGEEQARRFWGAVSLRREDIVTFLYKLHYSLHVPMWGAVDVGMWIMGIVAMVWVVDGFVALALAFPSRKAWRRSFRFRLREGSLKLLFDVHRSGGVWVWPLLLTLAVTGVSLNLGEEVMRPVVGSVLELTPDPFEAYPEAPPDQPIEPDLARAEVVEIARAEARRRGWQAPPGALFYAPDHGVYGVGFYEPGDDHGAGLGNPWIYVHGADGTIAGDYVPGSGTVGDIFLQAQFPVHSGRILGLPGRILVSLLGVMVAALSATGVWLWARRTVKRGVRARAPERAPALSRGA